MNKTPLLSIVIPTRNRHFSLEFTLQIVLKCYSNIEIIILDSSDEIPKDNLKLLLDNNKCKYIRTPTFFNGVQNFNEALNYVNGDFVTFIGDDDIVTPKIGWVLEYMVAHSIDSVISTFPINYQWPGYNTRFGKDKLSGSLVISDYSNAIKEINPLNEQKKALNELISGPLNLPRIYLGIVSSSLLIQCANKHGNIFGGVSPDIYSSLILSAMSKKCIQIDAPFIIPGAFKTSTSATSAAGKHKSTILNNDHTSRFPNLKNAWNFNVPFIYTVQTVWAYSLIEAYKKVYKKDIEDYSPIYAALLFNILEFKNEIFSSYKLCRFESRFNHYNFFRILLLTIWKKIINKIFRKKVRILYGFENSLSALKYINSLN
jgi:hypothetical protein